MYVIPVDGFVSIGACVVIFYFIYLHIKDKEATDDAQKKKKYDPFFGLHLLLFTLHCSIFLV